MSAAPASRAAEAAAAVAVAAPRAAASRAAAAPPAAEAADALRARPDVSANMVQREWNKHAIQLLNDRLYLIPLVAARREQIETLRDVGQAADDNIRNGIATLIDLNLVNAFAMLAIFSRDVVWKNSLVSAIVSGGGRVFRGIDPSMRPEHMDALTLYIAGRLAPAGGSKSFRRRRGKKTRLTRRLK